MSMTRFSSLSEARRTVFMGARTALQQTASRGRLGALKMGFSNLETEGRVTIGPGCDIYAARDSRILVDDCAIARGVSLTTSPGAILELKADFVGPGSIIVARERIDIGRGTKIAELVTIRDGNHDRRFPLHEKKFVTSPVIIGEDVWIGAKASVLAGVRIGSGATVAAGAVVVRDVPPGSTVGGVPARVLGVTSRGMNH